MRALTGKVAIAVRGKCSFSDKARRSAAAGAVALIVVNTDDEPFPPGGEGSMVLVGRSDGERLERGDVGRAPVTADALVWRAPLETLDVVDGDGAQRRVGDEQGASS